MNQSYFDAVILGDSLAARLAAALLARRGCRLLTLHPAGGAAPSAWCFSSLFLERMLDQLDGRAVLTMPQRFQYLGDGVRLDMHGRQPFAEEVRREFPRDVEAILGATADLAALGEKFAGLLWDSGGLPLAGIRDRWAFRLRGLRRGLTPGRLGEPLADRLAELDSPAAATFLGNLLPALSLTSVEQLSLAEAALLWHGAMRPTAASTAGLDELLRRRYQQFHGEEEDLAKLESLTPGDRQPNRLRFKGGQQVAAGCLVVADAAAALHLPEALRPAAAASSRPAAPLLLGNTVSPVLADQVVLAGSPLLRLSFSGPPEQRRLVVEAPREIAADELCGRLQALCPFAPLAGELVAGVPSPAGPPGLRAAMRRAVAGPGLFHCSPAVLPRLGSVGEALTGLSVARAVQRRLKKAAP